MKKWERLPHTADIKIRVYGTTEKELFEHAVCAMFEVLGPLPRSQKKETRSDQRLVHIMAHDRASLLVDFLSEALYLSEVHGESYAVCTIELFRPWEITARLHGFPIEGFESGEIKAVTYHELEMREHKGIWQADIVFDV